MKTPICLAAYLLVISTISWAGPSEESCARSLDRTVEIYSRLGGLKDNSTRVLMGGLIDISAGKLWKVSGELNSDIDTRAKQLQVLADDESREFEKSVRAQFDQLDANGRGALDDSLERWTRSAGINSDLGDDLMIRANRITDLKDRLRGWKALEGFDSTGTHVDTWVQNLPADFRHMIGSKNADEIKSLIEARIAAEEGEIQTLFNRASSKANVQEFVQRAPGIRAWLRKYSDLESARKAQFYANRLVLVNQVRDTIKARELTNPTILMRRVGQELPTSAANRTVQDEITSLEEQQKRLATDMESLRSEIREGAPDAATKGRTLISKAEAFGANQSALDEVVGQSDEFKSATVKVLLAEEKDSFNRVSKFRFSVLSKYLPQTPSFGTY
ncbi:MAG: hypothetical protein ABL958_20290 [Bdellovibrionia bacterium]